MAFDHTCKFLVESFPTDFACWLLGTPISMTKLEPSELSVEPIRADSVIFLVSISLILHIEFQTRPDEGMAFRMLDYWVRLHRKYPDKEIYQIVIYLKPSDSALVHQTSFVAKQISHNYNAIRLWEEPTEIFQQYPGLLPLSALTKTEDVAETLRSTKQIIDQIEDRKLKANLASATYIISGLVLDKEIVNRILRSDTMKESVTYQEILLEGKAEGKVEGKAEERIQIALNMLNSGLDIDLIAKLTGLSASQILGLK
jgi:predicted transposase/invertase (TIGR01784 family)